MYEASADFPSIDKRTFKQISDLVYEKCGICLNQKKEALVQARISKRMRALGIKDFKSYFAFVESDETGGELTAMLDAISTNVTHFFRESRHFDLLGEFLQRWEQAGQSRFRIWSSASSSGEEPYTIAITAREALQNASDCKILATDISTRIVKKAQQGIYSERNVDKVPRPLLARYFRRLPSLPGAEKHFEVDPLLKHMVKFGHINLSKPPFPLRGPLDVIFCRNVMIYFDNKVRRELLADMYRLLKPGGYLMVGHAESLSGMLSDFKSIEPSVYIKT
ncbi:MAG: methyltransferase domain-containing protein [Spartobacteria bacterium]|nr:methyltransferase domain-containing protein [Spartobacteria bacterium]